MNSQKEKLAFSCVLCNSSYKSEQGLKQHYARTSCELPTHQCQAIQEHQSTQGQHQSTYKQQDQSSYKQELLVPPLNNNEVMHYTWGRYQDKEFEENFAFIYKQIDELTKLFNAWIGDSPLKKIAM